MHPTIVRLFTTHGLRRDFTTCWPWAGATTPTGYGTISYRGDRKTTIIAHRAAYQLFKGPIPAGLEIDHLCRNRGCVNPMHLEAVTHTENVRRSNIATGDRSGNGRKTHCPHGHPYDEANTYTYQGRRHCRTCNRAHTAAWYAARRAA